MFLLQRAKGNEMKREEEEEEEEEEGGRDADVADDLFS